MLFLVRVYFDFSRASDVFEGHSSVCRASALFFSSLKMYFPESKLCLFDRGSIASSHSISLIGVVLGVQMISRRMCF